MSYSSVVLIIQARMNSLRFPNKSICDLGGAPMIVRILQRVKKAKKIKKIILATTKRKDDNILVNIGKLNNYQHKLYIDQNVTPIAQKTRRMPFLMRKQIDKQLDELLNLRVIEPVSGP